jgi:hypothetical protein
MMSISLFFVQPVSSPWVVLESERSLMRSETEQAASLRVP